MARMRADDRSCELMSSRLNFNLSLLYLSPSPPSDSFSLREMNLARISTHTSCQSNSLAITHCPEPSSTHDRPSMLKES